MSIEKPFHRMGANPIKPDDFHHYGANPIKPDDFHHYGADKASPASASASASYPSASPDTPSPYYAYQPLSVSPQ